MATFLVGLQKPFFCNATMKRDDVTPETRRLVTPRHDVEAPGALVMPRPSDTHQVTVTDGLSVDYLSRNQHSVISH